MKTTEVNTCNYLETSSDGLRKLFLDGVETINEYIETSGKITVDDVWEIADGLVPVYNADLLELANEDLSLGYLPDDYCDLKTDNVYDIIMRSVHYELDSALYRYCESTFAGKGSVWEA